MERDNVASVTCDVTRDKWCDRPCDRRHDKSVTSRCDTPHACVAPAWVRARSWPCLAIRYKKPPPDLAGLPRARGKSAQRQGVRNHPEGAGASMLRTADSGGGASR